MKSAVKARTPRRTKKIPVTVQCREILVHVKCNDSQNGIGYSYDLMLYGKQHHWADEQSIFTIARCDSGIVHGLKQAPSDERLTPEQGLILRIHVEETTIEWRRHEPLAMPGFLVQGDIERVSLHGVGANAHLICLIDQMPEAVQVPVNLTTKEDELLDPPF